MRFKFITFAVLPLLLIGCSAVTQPSTVNSLQIKVAHLEKRLADRESDIERLKAEVDILSKNTQQASVDYGDPFIEDVGIEPDYAVQVTDVEKERILRVDASIKDLQRALAKSGFYSDAIDGKLGNNTKKGIREFQKAHDLTVDGIVGQATWNELKNYLD